MNAKNLFARIINKYVKENVKAINFVPIVQIYLNALNAKKLVKVEMALINVVLQGFF